MVSLPSHSDVGTLLKAKDSSFLSSLAFSLQILQCTVQLVRWYRDPRSKDREESDLLEREENKILTAAQPVCCCVVLLQCTKLPSRGALTAASDTDTIDSAVRSACTV